MSETHTEFSPEQNLAYIRDIMQKSKNTSFKAGVFLLVWGGLSSVVTFLQFLSLKGYFSPSFMPYFWACFVILGTGFSIIYGRKLEKTAAPSFAENITKQIFICAGISIFIYFQPLLLV